MGSFANFLYSLKKGLARSSFQQVCFQLILLSVISLGGQPYRPPRVIVPILPCAEPVGSQVTLPGSVVTVALSWWPRAAPRWLLPFLIGAFVTALAWALSLRREGSELAGVFLERLQSVVREIAAGKHERDVLRESEERFRQLAENMRDIVWIVSLDGRKTLFVNTAFETITGRTIESLYDQPNCLDLVHPEDRAQAVATLFKQVLDRYDGDAEFRIVRPDGAMRWVRCRVFTILKNRGESNQVGCVTEDITDRKRAMEELQAAETKYRTIFENSMEGIYRATPDGRYLAANPALARMYGYDGPADLIRSVTNIEQQVYVEPTGRQKLMRLLRQYDAVSGLKRSIAGKMGA